MSAINRISHPRIDHVEADEFNGTRYRVIAFDAVFGDELVVAEFPYDDGPDMEHHKEVAGSLALACEETIRATSKVG